MPTIFHIISAAAWEEARSIGLYAPESLRAEGFIHFSTADQVVRVANSFYRGEPNLVLLVVDTDRLTSRLKWEAPIHPNQSSPGADMPVIEEQFPHLYGPLNLDAVTRVLDFTPGADGTFTMPDL